MQKAQRDVLNCRLTYFGKLSGLKDSGLRLGNVFNNLELMILRKKESAPGQLVPGLGPQSGVGAHLGGAGPRLSFDFSCQQRAFSDLFRGFSAS